MKKTSFFFLLIFLAACSGNQKTRVIFDTDANNELDDQHAIAYLIGNDDLFHIEGITTNRTRNGGPVENHTREAERIVHLCGAVGEFPVISGASGTYREIKEHLDESAHDGHRAVDFIIEQALATPPGEKLLLLPVGKLTNIALAIEKEPAIADRVKVVWLGSNWPGPGEYNMVNDTSAVNPVIESGVEMWICTVSGGTMDVKTTRSAIINHLKDLGPDVEPVTGRHGGEFELLGNYLIDLWEHVQETRSLFDMAAVATVKDPSWAERTVQYGPRLAGGEWTVEEGATDSVVFFRNYDVEAVMNDFWEVMERFGTEKKDKETGTDEDETGMGTAENHTVQKPVIAGDWWRICEMPDLGELQGPDPERQHIVDHGFIRAEDGTWQLWACMRGTGVGRLLYGWEGKSLEKGPWEPLGVVARANPSFGEQATPHETMQAPYFMKTGDKYLCFYNSNGIRLMTSTDGKHYTRKIIKDNNNVLYREGGRDVTVLREENTWYAYSTISTVAKDGWKYGFIILRTSRNLKDWSDYTIVSSGGRAGNGPVSAESPFVLKKDGYYYLFRASSITFKTYVYRSKDPYHFGVNEDSKLITELPVKAPEIILHRGQYYISDLSDWQGIKLAKLKWIASKI